MSVSINGTGGITFADASTQSTGGYTGFRNRIINGDMRIDQRNAGAAVTLPAGIDKWITDRWSMQSQAGGTGQRIPATIAMGSPYSLKYTSTTSSTFFQMGQQIEYLNMSDFQNETITISFWAKANNSNSGSTNFVVRTRTSTTPDAGVRFSGANSDTSVTISTTAQRYQVTRSIASGVSALSIEFVLGSHVSGDGFEITGVQLEKGSVATPFEFRPYGTELALCQRYYQQWDYTAALGYGGGTAFAATKFSTTDAIVANAGTNGPMRASPTVTSTNSTVRAVFNTAITSATISGISINSSGVGILTITCVNNALAAGFGWIDQLGTIKASAEL